MNDSKQLANLSELVSAAYADRELLKQSIHQDAVRSTIHLLDHGKVRVVEKIDGKWRINEWVRSAILLLFALNKTTPIEVGPFRFADKIELKTNYDKLGVRVVPPAVARYGSFMQEGVVLMPSYVNIGAFIGANTMIDNWALVGSCAHVGRDVHISAGVIIGGVLEPVGAFPVIIEDGAFIGASSTVVEGVLVESEAVLGANVSLTASTPIIDVTKKEPVTYKGRVPAGSVVIPGTYPKEFPAGKFEVACALIIGQRSPATDRKTSLNTTLREFGMV